MKNTPEQFVSTIFETEERSKAYKLLIHRVKKEMRGIDKRKEKIDNLVKRFDTIKVTYVIAERPLRPDKFRLLAAIPEIKSFILDVKKILDEIQHATNRIVASRMQLALGTDIELGKLDLSVNVANRSKEAQKLEPQVALITRLLIDTIDLVLYPIEEMLHAQGKIVSTMREEVLRLNVKDQAKKP